MLQNINLNSPAFSCHRTISVTTDRYYGIMAANTDHGWQSAEWVFAISTQLIIIGSHKGINHLLNVVQRPDTPANRESPVPEA